MCSEAAERALVHRHYLTVVAVDNAQNTITLGFQPPGEPLPVTVEPDPDDPTVVNIWVGGSPE